MLYTQQQMWEEIQREGAAAGEELGLPVSVAQQEEHLRSESVAFDEGLEKGLMN